MGNGLILYHAPAWGCHEHKFTIFTTELTTAPGAALATPGDFVVQFNVVCFCVDVRLAYVFIDMKCG